jgi:hypothetical protein
MRPTTTNSRNEPTRTIIKITEEIFIADVEDDEDELSAEFDKVDVGEVTEPDTETGTRGAFGCAKETDDLIFVEPDNKDVRESCGLFRLGMLVI